MAVTIKTEEEIELMAEAGRLLGLVHEILEKEIRPGITTAQIDAVGEEAIRSFNCEPNFLDYNGYPASVCVSVNDEVVHGIPSEDVILQEGDIVSLDTGLIYKGYHSDAARTYGVGKISDAKRLLIERTRQSFFEGIKYATEGNHLNDVSRHIGKYCKQFGYGVVKDMVGHGIGTHLHEDPEVPNFAKLRRGIKLQKGMTLAVEPMINLGTHKIALMEDDWTVVTWDGLASAHYENTIAITEGAPRILTLTPKEIADGFGTVEVIKR